MSAMAMLEVVIGLVFVYLLLGLVCTIVCEWLAQVMSLRSKNLEEGVKNLLADPNMQGLAKKVYGHPLIKNLAKSGSRPSYLSGEVFSRVLVDVIDPKAKDAKDAAAAVKSVKDALNSAALPDDVKTAVQALIDDATGSIADIRKNIQDWFDGSMDRVAGWYKRKIRIISLLVAIAIAIGLNADSLLIAKALWQDPVLREAVAEQADSALTKCARNQKGKVSLSECQSFKTIKEELRSLPLGWSNQSEDKRHFLWRLIGWIITGLAVSLGAPFWFDVLTKLNSIRSSGLAARKKPETQGA